MTPFRDMSDEEWHRVALLLPELRPRRELRGRPLASTRAVMNGVLCVMSSGMTWSAMPHRYPSYQTCHRRFKAWYLSGALKEVLLQLYGADGAEMYRLMEIRMRPRTKRALLAAAPSSTRVSPAPAREPAPAARELAAPLEQVA
jgi:transposase